MLSQIVQNGPPLIWHLTLDDFLVSSHHTDTKNLSGMFDLGLQPDSGFQILNPAYFGILESGFKNPIHLI